MGTGWDGLSPQQSHPAQHRRKFPPEHTQTSRFLSFPLSQLRSGRKDSTHLNANHVYFMSQRLISLGVFHIATESGPGLGPVGGSACTPPPQRVAVPRLLTAGTLCAPIATLRLPSGARSTGQAERLGAAACPAPGSAVNFRAWNRFKPFSLNRATWGPPFNSKDDELYRYLPPHPKFPRLETWLLVYTVFMAVGDIDGLFQVMHDATTWKLLKHARVMVPSFRKLPVYTRQPAIYTDT